MWNSLIALVMLLTLILPVQTLAYEVVNVSGGATVKGTVVFSGTPPPDETIRIDRNTGYCGETQQAGKYLINNGRIKNVVVWIEGVRYGKSIPESVVKIEISRCRVQPLVSVGFVGGIYRIINRDPILHTIQLKLELSYHKEVSKRPLPDGATVYNLALPKQDMEITRPIKWFHRYTEKTGFLRVTSNAHPWMRGFIFVFDHPYAAVTDEAGSFVISNIPSGRYTLKIWHEALGMKSLPLKLKKGEIRYVTIEFSR